MQVKIVYDEKNVKRNNMDVCRNDDLIIYDTVYTWCNNGK